jgi:hypothetical protein
MRLSFFELASGLYCLYLFADGLVCMWDLLWGNFYEEDEDG